VVSRTSVDLESGVAQQSAAHNGSAVGTVATL